jgi:hypothetical protein
MVDFNLGAGLAEAGATVAKIAGAGALEAQKSELEKQKLDIANQMAIQRESIGRAETHGYTMAQQADKQKFEGGENEKTRATQLEGHRIAAGATLGAAAANAKAHLDGIKITAQAHIEAERIKAQAHLEYADKTIAGRETVAKLNEEQKKRIRETSLLSDDAIEAAAWFKITTGKDSPFTTGFGGRADKAAVANKVAEIAKDNGWSPEDIAAQVGNATSAQAALNQMSKQATAIKAFSSTADKVGQIVVETADAGGADPTGVKVFNRWVQAGKKDIVGDAEVSAFNAALVTWRSETAKILSGSMGNTPASDSKNAEIKDMVDRADTADALKAVIKIFTMERINRIKGLDEQMTDLNNVLKGGSLPSRNKEPTVTPAATPSNPTGAYPIPRGADGKMDIAAVTRISKEHPGAKFLLENGQIGVWDPKALGLVVPNATVK